MVEECGFACTWSSGSCGRRAHRLADRSVNWWWSAFGKSWRGKNGKPGRPVHDDLVQRNITAHEPNRLWISDITDHRTYKESRLLCAVEDIFSNRIIGYYIDSRIKSRLAVTAR
ncbi:hypothetical protein [Nocardia nova]|jgi:transposase InsO family protein|uniref:hypothetical protein n=1 Tax=Nocardia nova TaxID=37330 RepID=UPI0007A4FB49|nr:hypothetical protein [Nocardia nova]